MTRTQRARISHRTTHSVEDSITKKIRFIDTILKTDPIDVLALRRFAISEGLVNNEVRRRVWPVLLGAIDSCSQQSVLAKVHPYRDDEQIQLDVRRSLWRFTGHMRATAREQRRKELTTLMSAVLCSHEELHYYQGYNEVSSLILLVMDTEAQAFPLLERISLHHLRAAMFPNLDAITGCLQLLMPLLKLCDTELYDFVFSSGMNDGTFAVSWVLTWFSYKLESLEVAARLFDVFIASHPLTSLYIAVSVVQQLRSTILALECEYTEVYACLQRLPENLDWEAVIARAAHQQEQYSPLYLQRLAKISLGRSSPFNAFPYPWVWKTLHPRDLVPPTPAKYDPTWKKAGHTHMQRKRPLLPASTFTKPAVQYALSAGGVLCSVALLLSRQYF